MLKAFSLFSFFPCVCVRLKGEANTLEGHGLSTMNEKIINNKSAGQISQTMEMKQEVRRD